MYPSNSDTAVYQVAAQSSPYLAVGQNLLNVGTSIYNTERTISANKEMSEKAYANDLAMWEKNNQYNAPSAQMARLKMAGLNPNLVYGNGSVVGNTSGSIPKYNPPNLEYNYQPPNVLGTLGSYLDLKAKAAEIDRIQKMSQSVSLDNMLKAQTLDYNIQLKSEGAKQSLHKTDSMAYRANIDSIRSGLMSYLESNGLMLQNETNRLALQRGQLGLQNSQMAKYNADITGVKQSNILRQMDIDLYKKVGGTSSGIGGFGRLALDLIRILKGH